MAKVKDVQKAISVLETAKKQVIAVLGEMASLSFMPIESSLKAELERANAHNPYEGLSDEEVESKKEEARKTQLEQLEKEANERLAQIMEARSGKKEKPAPSEQDEQNGEINLPNGANVEPNGDKITPNGSGIEPNGDKITPNGSGIEPNGDNSTPNDSTIEPNGQNGTADGTSNAIPQTSADS
ncbi:hypothetical protein FHS57_006246 [Runella defluvii]|uniref:Uncharacterized protein n=1 Tax=Runella defluvii TaxID=370973 RepID=A0A7W5ZT34_9BACT|nr:hypothetical protein [Runella defluvii]MBB3842215.1 hypothetical protein [Runella defluvii]